MFPEDFPYYKSYNSISINNRSLMQPISNRMEMLSNCPIFSGQVQVIARIKGGPLAPNLLGIVLFRDVPGGTEVCADITGLPPYKPAKGSQAPVGPHGFHIHELGNCEVGEPQDPFKAAGEHWNPTNQPHGNHAGDFPVLFSNNGRARMCFFTDKFKPLDVIGKSVIIHQNPDDYRTQPAGNAGKRLACGVIERVKAV
jgi:Cu-Zn family superoxide dismutase